MSSFKNTAARAPTALLALFFGTAASLAQESAAPPPAAPPPPPVEAERAQDAETPPAAQRPDVENDEFIPTEELAPDAAVTFPVDI
jgi:hypothetical protein